MISTNGRKVARMVPSRLGCGLSESYFSISPALGLLPDRLEQHLLLAVDPVR